jgi:UDP-N-acetylmuramoylalanine--D-glutamate ligase
MINEKLIVFKKHIKGKRIAVLGMGISNMPLIKYLAQQDANITAFDMAEEFTMTDKIKELESYDIKYSLGQNYLNNLYGFDIIFKTPSIRYDIKELVEEKKRGATITSEMEVFFNLCPAQIFGVTGSDGKTTTTTLIYKMLSEEGYKCWLGGNIGYPLLSKIEEIDKDDKVVVELSSFQLHTMNISPHIAVITNLSPNHLDMHKSMDEYVRAKENIYLFQNSNDMLIVKYDNEITRPFINQGKGNVRKFSRINNISKGAFMKKSKLVYKDEQREYNIIDVNDIKILGNHNIENYLAAISAVIDYVKPETIEKIGKTFNGVEHRMELVRELKGIKFYNDSIGSSPTRTIAGLKIFKEKVILIAGGYDKNLCYDELATIIMRKVKVLVLIGQTGEVIYNAIMKKIKESAESHNIEIIHSTSLEDAVNVAYNKANNNDNIVLSPASASFDMFKNFEDRGNVFKSIVKTLK